MNKRTSAIFDPCTKVQACMFMYNFKYSALSSQTTLHFTTMADLHSFRLLCEAFSHAAITARRLFNHIFLPLSTAIFPCCNYRMKTIQSHIPPTVYSHFPMLQLLHEDYSITMSYSSHCLQPDTHLWSKRQCPSFETVPKGIRTSIESPA